MYRLFSKSVIQRHRMVIKSYIQEASELTTTKMSKMVEIVSNPEESLVSLPIVAFPPFQLRAALVEKDPVVWVHLLEAYNQLMTQLLEHKELTRLNENTWEQLCIFVRSFLHEISSEMGQLLSLGSNVEVTKNLFHLKRWVLRLIEMGGGVHKLQMNGATLWDFVRIYVETDPNAVRKVVSEGGKIDCTYMIHNHLEFLVGSGKFNRFDLKSFENFIDRKTTKKSLKKNALNKNGKVSSKDRKYDSNNFVDQFVTVKWIEILEKLYNNGKGVHLQTSKQLMIITLLNCSVQTISSLSTQLSISSLPALKLYPLFGVVLWIGYSEKNYFQGLEMRLPFLKVVKNPKSNNNKNGAVQGSSSNDSLSLPKIDMESSRKVQDLFPDLPVPKISKLYQKYGNVELLINALFENPGIVDELELEEAAQLKESMGLKDFKSKLKITNKKMSSKKNNKPIVDRGVPDEVRNKTMTAALKLLYDANEDERDDTYDEAESQTAGVEKTKEQAQFDKVEEYLWNLLKKDVALFTRESRKSSLRKDMKAQTKWSDEQIEGWARMIERSPARAQLLEEKYMFRNPNSSKKRGDKQAVEEEDDTSDPKRETSNNGSPKDTNPNSKRQNARNEKNKSSRANHNRKSQHDKKMNKAL